MPLASAHQRLAGYAAAEGLPFAPPDRAWDTRRAQELAAWAAATAPQDRVDALHTALFRAVFADGENIGRRDVLVGIAERVGCDPDAVRAALDARAGQADVDRDWAFARQVGVTGVPTYAIGGRGVVGAQPYAVLEQLAAQAGVARR